MRARPDARVSVVVQQSAAPGVSLNLDSLLNLVGGRVTRRFGKLGALAVSLPSKGAEALAARPDVFYVSPDRILGAAGHIETTTGTDQIRTQTVVSLLGITTTTTLDGGGIGIVV